MRLHGWIICSILLSPHAVHAQDPHFSQFFASPLTLNPAFTGHVDGMTRLSTNYRNQWPAYGNAYRTYTASIDGPLSLRILPENDRLGAGLLLYSDESGNGILSERHAALSVSYAKALDVEGRHTLTAGFQGSYGSYRFDVSKADFMDELGASGFTLPTSELFGNTRLSRPVADLHAGLLYMGAMGYDGMFYLGGAFYHLLKPSLGFSSTEYRVAPRLSLQSGLMVETGTYTTIHASLQYQRHFNYSGWAVGGAVSRMVVDGQEDYLELYAGLWLRNGSTLVPYLGIEYDGLRAGFTYDTSLSGEQAAATSLQSAEISINWTIRGLQQDRRFKCPVF